MGKDRKNDIYNLLFVYTACQRSLDDFLAFLAFLYYWRPDVLGTGRTPEVVIKPKPPYQMRLTSVVLFYLMPALVLWISAQ